MDTTIDADTAKENMSLMVTQEKGMLWIIELTNAYLN